MLTKFFLIVANIWMLNVHAGITLLPRDFSSETDAACIGSSLGNGNFESGKLAPWKNSTYLGGHTSVNIVSGFKSKYAAELKVTTDPGQTGGTIGNLFQEIQLCKNVKYTFSWAQYQVPNATYLNNPSAANMYPDVIDSSGGEYGSYGFQVHPNYYTSGKKHYPAGHWQTFKETITPQTSGTFSIEFEILLSDESSGSTFRFDNVVFTA